MKIYFIIAFILVGVSAVELSIYFFKPNEAVTKNSVNTSLNTTADTPIKSAQTVESKHLSKTESEVADKTEATKIPATKPVPDLSLAIKPGVQDNEIIGENADNAKYPEPTDNNADLVAIGLFADQVNLGKNNKLCEHSCADSSNIMEPAQGDYAEQINTSSLLLQARLEGVVDTEIGTQLHDVQTNSHPPVETGAYIIPD